jgi:Copper binding periplasmic protein CusF
MKIAKIIMYGWHCGPHHHQLGGFGPTSAYWERLPELTGSIAPSRFKTQSGTIGANTGGAAEEFKAQNGLSLDALHAGDKVTFSATETGGIKTITKLQKQ